jgi:hypothetical protein
MVPEGCPEGKYYAFITDDAGCHGLKSSDKKANTVAVDMTSDDQSNIITGISLLYLSDDDNYRLMVNITCDASMGNGLVPMGIDGNTVSYRSAKGCPVF